MFKRRKSKPIKGSRKFNIKELPWKFIFKSVLALSICAFLIVQVLGYRHYYEKSVNAAADNAALASQLNLLSSDIDAKKQQIDALTKSQTDSTKELRASIESLSKQLSETAKDNKELTADLNSVKSANDVLRQKLSTIIGSASRSGSGIAPTASGRSGLTLANLKTLTKGTGLVGTEEAFLAIEKANNVNALFAIAVAKHESGNGYSSLSIHQNNLFGLKGYNGWMSFKTKSACIAYFGQLIQKNYIRKGYTTPARIGMKYAESNAWASRITEYMIREMKKVYR